MSRNRLDHLINAHSKTVGRAILYIQRIQGNIKRRCADLIVANEKGGVNGSMGEGVGNIRKKGDNRAERAY